MGIQDIRNRLEEWKTDDIYKNCKSYKEYKSNMVNGEYYYVLSWRLNLKLMGIPQDIYQVKKFHTQTLASEPFSVHPDADIYRLNGLLPAFDTEFLKKVDDAYTNMLEEKNPPGFF